MRPYIFKKENLILFLTLIIPIIFISFKAKATILIDSDTIANIAERTSNTVVNIESSKKTKEPEVREPKNLNLGGIEITIPRITPQPQSGTGSGIIIQSDGYILTNYHVIKDSDLNDFNSSLSEFKEVIQVKSKENISLVVYASQKMLNKMNFSNRIIQIKEYSSFFDEKYGLIDDLKVSCYFCRYDNLK